MRPTLVSLFSGAAGLDIGLEQAGFDTVCAVDSDEDCVATLLANNRRGVRIENSRRRYLSDAMIDCKDVTVVSGSELRPPEAPRDWHPDLLAGGPPCQPFSSAGKMRSVKDPRGRLFESFVRLASELKPRRILFENVRGLVTARGPRGKPGEVLELVNDAFERAGYATSFALLNAADFGAPQRRVRCFMLGARRDLGETLPDFPEATHDRFPESSGRLPWVTLGEFLDAFRRRHGAPEASELVLPSRRAAARLRSVPDGSGLRSMGAKETTRPGGHWGYTQGMFVADLGLPARTVTAAQTQDWVRLDGSLRRLTLRECAQLQGFPEDWEFVGSKASRFRQVGNAVPTVFGRVLGQAIVKSLAKGERRRPLSQMLPSEFHVAIRSTSREHERNGASRKAARRGRLTTS